MRDREFCSLLPVDLIGDAHRYLVKIPQNVEHSERYICGSLQAASVFGGNAVIPADSSGSSCGSTVLAAVSASSAEFLSFAPEDLGSEFSRTYCGRIGFIDDHDLLNSVGRNSRADRAVSSQSAGRGDHGIDTVVRILHSAELALKKDRLSLFDGLFQVLGDIAHIGSDHVAVLQKRLKKRLLIDGIFVIEIDQKDVFFDTDIRDLLRKDTLLIKQLVDLEPDLGIFIGIERRDA